MKKKMILISFIFTTLLFSLSCSTGDMPDKGITILNPKAGDIVPAGSPYAIQWKTEVPDEQAFGAMLSIEFSKDGGKTWQQVEENVPKDGKYSWQVPKIDSAQCKVRVFSQRSVEYRGTSGAFAVK